jgi:hypothetical protein
VNAGAACFAPITNCAVQTSASECTACSSGFDLSSDKKSCAVPFAFSSNSIYSMAFIKFIMAFFILFF